MTIPSLTFTCSPWFITPLFISFFVTLKFNTLITLFSHLRKFTSRPFLLWNNKILVSGKQNKTLKCCRRKANYMNQMMNLYKSYNKANKQYNNKETIYKKKEKKTNLRYSTACLIVYLVFFWCLKFVVSYYCVPHWFFELHIRAKKMSPQAWELLWKKSGFLPRRV